MDERSQVLLSTLLGAVAGAVLGGLYLTKHGRQVRDQIEPALDGFMSEIERARGTIEKAREAAREGRRAFDDLMNETHVPDASTSEGSDTTWTGRGVREVSS